MTPKTYWGIEDKEGNIWGEYTRMTERGPIDDMIKLMGEESARIVAEALGLRTIKVSVAKELEVAHDE